MSVVRTKVALEREFAYAMMYQLVHIDERCREITRGSPVESALWLPGEPPGYQGTNCECTPLGRAVIDGVDGQRVVCRERKTKSMLRRRRRFDAASSVVAAYAWENSSETARRTKRPSALLSLENSDGLTPTHSQLRSGHSQANRCYSDEDVEGLVVQYRSSTCGRRQMDKRPASREESHAGYECGVVHMHPRMSNNVEKTSGVGGRRFWLNIYGGVS